MDFHVQRIFNTLGNYTRRNKQLVTFASAQRRTRVQAQVLSAVLFIVLSASTAHSQTLTSSLRASQGVPIKKKDGSVYVVSDEELKTYASTSDLLKEIEMLKKHRDSLLEYSKKIKERSNKLEEALRTRGQIAISTDGSKLQTQVAELQAALKTARQKNKNIETEFAALKIKHDVLLEESAALKAHVEATRSRAEECETEYAASESGDKSKITQLEHELSKHTSSEKACLEQLEQSQKLVMQIPDLEAELLSLRSDRLMRKTAAELLGHELDADSKGESNAPDAIRASKNNSDEGSKPQTRVASAATRSSVGPLESDITVVEVTGSRVALRAGPGTNHSSLMDIGKGARLTVESQEGQWFRVNAPTGGRAYIHSDYARVIGGGSMKNDKSLIPIPEVVTPLAGPPIRALKSQRVAANDTGAAGEAETLESLALKQLRAGMRSSKSE